MITWLERALWTLGIVLLGWSAWAWGDARWYQSRWSDALAGDASEPAFIAFERPGFEASSNILPVARPATGDPLAVLSIERLGLSTVVAEGTESWVLRRAVGRLSSSSLPGEDGNVVLAGHRDTFFRPLRDVQVGDVVQIERGGATDRYVVEWTEVVPPTAVHVARDTDYPALTLVTCYPFNYVGNAPERFVVRARRIGGFG